MVVLSVARAGATVHGHFRGATNEPEHLMAMVNNVPADWTGPRFDCRDENALMWPHLFWQAACARRARDNLVAWEKASSHERSAFVSRAGRSSKTWGNHHGPRCVRQNLA